MQMELGRLKKLLYGLFKQPYLSKNKIGTSSELPQLVPTNHKLNNIVLYSIQ